MDISQLRLVGGDLSLDFVNTVGGRLPLGNLDEYLNSYADLVQWSVRAGLANQATADSLMRHAASHPDDAARALSAARTLREALYRIFNASIIGQAPSSLDLEILNRILAQPGALLKIQYVDGKYVLRWTEDTQRLDSLLSTIARSAAALLASPRIARVRQCAGEECTWLFLDTSKNHSRRWCDMSECGNRAKARRHHARVASKRSPQGSAAAA